MKILMSLSFLALMLSASCVAAQSLDASASRVIPLSAQDAAGEPLAAQHQLQPVITKAWAREDAAGELSVECRVEPSPFIAPDDLSLPRRDTEIRP